MTQVPETERLSELASFDVLDTGSEPAFQALVEAAAHISDCPIALVSLLDVDRQWFKARVGLQAQQTSRDIAFCEYVLTTDRVLVVPDATADPRFAGNPLVTGELGVRFYAGFPLRTTSGAVLGTLCVLDNTPRPQGLTTEQADLLGLLADQVMAQLELRRALAQRDETVRELAASERRYRALAEDASDVVSQHALDGTTRYVSPSLASVLGYDPEREIGSAPVDRVHPGDAARMGGAIAAVRQGTPATVTVRSCHADGTWVTMEIRLSPVRDAAGEVVELHSVARDVSDREQAASDLRISEARFRALFDHSPVGQVEMSPDGIVLRVNKAFAELVGADAADLVGRTPAWATVPEQREDQRQALSAAAAAPGQVQRTDRRLVRTDGTTVDVAGTITAVPGLDGRAGVIIGSAVDMTSHHQHARELRAAAEELAATRDEAVRRAVLIDTVLDTVDVGIVACDADGRLTLFNRTTRMFHGIPADPTVDPTQWADRYALCAEDGTTPLTLDQVPLLRALHEGMVADAVITVAPDGLPARLVRCDGRALRDATGRLLGAVVVMADITQARATARELAEQAAFTQIVLDTAHSAIWACDATGRPTFLNPAMMRLVWPDRDPTAAAPTSDEILAVWRQVRVCGEDGRELAVRERPLPRALAEGEVGDLELVVAVPGRPARRLIVHASATYDAQGELTGAIATGHDVTGLRAAEARFRAAFHNGPTPVARLREDGVVLEVNPALRRLLGIRSAGLLGHPLEQQTHPEDRVPLKSVLGGPGTGAHPVELRLVRADGAAVWCELAMTRVTGAEGEGYLLAQLVDIDSRKHHELTLERAARQDPLTGLGNRAQILRHLTTQLDPGSPGATGVLFVDLDGFKEVNDTHGHDAGDAVLVEVARRLQANVRPGDVAMRFGGDEFIVICALPASATATALASLAVRVQDAIAAPIVHAGVTLVVGSSVGVAVAPAGRDPQALLDAADEAMYLRKRERQTAGPRGR